MATVPFSDSAAATSDASGNVTFTGFQQPRVGMWRTGSLSVVRSDGTAVVSGSVLPITWKAYVAKTIWGTWYNDQPSNLVQTAGPAVEVRGTNLAASTAYQCVFTGYDSDSPPTLSPLPAPAPPPSSPQLLPITGLNVAPADTVVTVGSAPVIVGTSVSVQASFSDASGQIELGWTTPALYAQGIYNLLGDFTFDLAQSALLKGLVLPNLGPLLVVKAVTHAASASLTINLFTGMPPIVRPPMAVGGDLTRYNAAIADGADSGLITLPPYVGDAQLFLTALVAGASPAAGAIFAILRSRDYTAAAPAELARVGATTQMLAGAGTTSLQPAYIWKMSPRINSIQVYNRIGGAVGVTVDMAISTTGP